MIIALRINSYKPLDSKSSSYAFCTSLAHCSLALFWESGGHSFVNMEYNLRKAIFWFMQVVVQAGTILFFENTRCVNKLLKMFFSQSNYIMDSHIIIYAQYWNGICGHIKPHLKIAFGHFIVNHCTRQHLKTNLAVFWRLLIF